MAGATTRSAVTVLFVLTAVGVLTAAGLTVVATLSPDQDTPEPCCDGPVADRDAWPSPSTPTPRPTEVERDAGLPSCVIGSWRTTEETMMVAFYTAWDEAPFRSSGRQHEFRPDGTMIETTTEVSLTGRDRGRDLLIVMNGTRRYEWTATGNRITYTGVSSTKVGRFYDNGRFVDTVDQRADPDRTDTVDYTCTGTELVIRGDNGFRATRVRTADAGVYG